jgi:hypothetical protein
MAHNSDYIKIICKNKKYYITDENDKFIVLVEDSDFMSTFFHYESSEYNGITLNTVYNINDEIFIHTIKSYCDEMVDIINLDQFLDKHKIHLENVVYKDLSYIGKLSYLFHNNKYVITRCRHRFGTKIYYCHYNEGMYDDMYIFDGKGFIRDKKNKEKEKEEEIEEEEEEEEEVEEENQEQYRDFSERLHKNIGLLKILKVNGEYIYSEFGSYANRGYKYVAIGES